MAAMQIACSAHFESSIRRHRNPRAPRAPVSCEKLSALLWDDSTRSARYSLRQLLLTLRKELNRGRGEGGPLLEGYDEVWLFAEGQRLADLAGRTREATKQAVRGEYLESIAAYRPGEDSEVPGEFVTV